MGIFGGYLNFFIVFLGIIHICVEIYLENDIKLFKIYVWLNFVLIIYIGIINFVKKNWFKISDFMKKIGFSYLKALNNWQIMFTNIFYTSDFHHNFLW